MAEESVLRHRWLIPDDGGSHGNSRDYWVRVHSEQDYEDVFSVGEDEGVRRRIVNAALRTGACDHVLLAGCGSRTALQQDLLENAGEGTHVVATDFEAALDVARRRFEHPRLTYVPLESGPAYEGRFDVVVAVNVLVSDSDAANRRLLAEWSRALLPGGRLIALLPSLSAGYELATLGERDDLLACLDWAGGRWFEPRQAISEVEYLPLRLRRILREAGLHLEELQIVFLDGPWSRDQARAHYGLEDDDLVIYEHLAIARRRLAAPGAEGHQI